MIRTRDERERDRADLLLYVTDAPGPVTLHQIATDTWDGTRSWPGHVDTVSGDLAALHRQHLLVTDGATYRGNLAARWATAVSPLADALSDLADARRQMTAWEPVE